MLTRNDEAFVAGLMADMARIGMPTDVTSYRSFLHELLEERKNGGEYPAIGRYLPGHRIGKNLLADIAVPTGDGPFPVSLVCHGNGGIGGSAHSYRRYTHELAAQGFLAVTPDYRLGPEHRHPSALEDMVAAAHWVFDNAAQFGGDPDRVALIGDSSGSGIGLATVLALGERADGRTIKAFAGLEGAYDREKGGFFSDAFMPDGYTEADVHHPTASPIRAITKETVLPRILLLTGSKDMLAGRTMNLAQRLWENGHDFALHLLEGMPHDFMKFPTLDGYREGHRLLADFLNAATAPE